MIQIVCPEIKISFMITMLKPCVFSSIYELEEKKPDHHGNSKWTILTPVTVLMIHALWTELEMQIDMSTENVQRMNTEVEKFNCDMKDYD